MFQRLRSDARPVEADRAASTWRGSVTPPAGDPLALSTKHKPFQVFGSRYSTIEGLDRPHIRFSGAAPSGQAGQPGPLRATGDF